jgi:hypothetical protein
VKFLELVQSKPDNVVGHGRTSFLLHQLAELSWSSLAIAMLPNESSRLIETVSFVSIKIIDQDFVVYFFDY